MYNIFISCFKLVCPIPPVQPHYNYSRANWQGLCDFFSNYDFSFCSIPQDINSMWDKLYAIILDGCDRFIPKCTGRNKCMLPKQLTSSLHHSLNKLGEQQHKREILLIYSQNLKTWNFYQRRRSILMAKKSPP